MPPIVDIAASQGLARVSQIGKCRGGVVRRRAASFKDFRDIDVCSMTLLANLKASGAVRVVRYADVDHFRMIERLVTARSIPTDVRHFEGSRATLALPACTIFLTKTFPRIVEADFHSDGVIVGIPMEDGATLTLNGLETGDDTLFLARGTGPSDLVEPRANLFAILMFNAPMRDRGWPSIEDVARIVRPNAGGLRRVQAAIREILLFASTSASEFAMPGVADGLENSLVAAIDAALIDCEQAVAQRRAVAHGNYLNLVRQLDEILSRSLGATLYSHELAGQLGISVRTLHNAVVAIRGRPLHDYIRLQRLWRVHQTLVSGAPVQIKSVALANGFWHPGEFSQSYRALFGEPPSQTLCRARGD